MGVVYRLRQVRPAIPSGHRSIRGFGYSSASMKLQATMRLAIVIAIFHLGFLIEAQAGKQVEGSDVAD